MYIFDKTGAYIYVYLTSNINVIVLPNIKALTYSITADSVHYYINKQA